MSLNNQVNNYRQLLRKLKGEYRTITGYDSDSNWLRFKQTLEELELLSPELPDKMNRDNILLFSKLRCDLPKTAIPLKDAFKFYLEQRKFTEALNGRRLTGEEILKHLATQGIEVTSPTKTNWFKPIGGYRSRAEYLPEEILKVLYRAAIYKAKQKKINQAKLGEQ